MKRHISNINGFTMIELVIVIMIIGILAAVAVQRIGFITESSRFENTRAEMDILAEAIIGNETLQNNGIRSDYGYVGDNGALPPDLDALVNDPGLGTWNGPYLVNSFEQYADDYKEDAWGIAYSYSGGVTIQSTGGSETITRRLASSIDDLLFNKVAGNVYDYDGTPPDNVYRDSITIIISYPDGFGMITSKNFSPGNGGYFEFDSIPVGNHLLQAVYLPDHDTLVQYVSVNPGSTDYISIKFGSDYWFADANSGLPVLTDLCWLIEPGVMFDKRSKALDYESNWL